MDPALWETIEGGAATEVVAVLVRLRADAAPPRGLEIVARFGDVATARIARSAIIAVHDDPVVVSLKAACELRPEPAVAGAGAAARRRLGRAARRGLAAGPSGRGVVVGVIDWGVDFTHPNFVRDDGRTRLLALWDQRRRRAGGLPPYGYGRAWSRRQLDAALGARDPFATLGYDPADADVDGNGTHGTHVLDIAAGAPRIGPGGVAPGAELVFVHLASEPTGPRSIGNSVSLLEGLDFIARVAGDRPCVVNFSLGSHAGPHDGSTLVEQALDAFVTARPGRAIVQSAGNYRRAPVHATGALARGDRAVLEWVVSAGDETTNELDLWYPGRDRLEVRLRADDGRVVARATPDSHGPVVDDGDVIGRFAHRTLDPNNGDNHVALVLEPRGSAARWRVEVEPLRVAATGDRWHAWIERDEAGRGSQSRLRAPDASPASTTGTIANGHFTIVVGAVDATTGRVAPFSSAGPTRDGRIKPDLLAPGVGIVAARSTPADDAVAAPLLTRKSGTSMAAPYGTGAVAVIYEAAGRPLTIAAVRDLLGIRAGRAAAAIDLAAAVRAARAAPDGPAGVAPAALFDAFTAPARAAARFALPDVALVAAAGAAPTLDLRPGDWLIERALGEG
ncbi:MAG: S8 family serine peptidase [Myxococcales bacterium]|nr:S8 family serine peptidase [Myxococcales bacterium]